MSLTSNFALAGAGIVTSYQKNTRQWHTEGIATGYPGGPGYQSWFIEVREIEVREWLALTEACAKGQAEANVQPAQVGYEERSYSYSVQEVLRPTRSYKLVRTSETILEYQTSNTLFAIPILNPNGGSVAYPATITLTLGSGGKGVPNMYWVRKNGSFWAVGGLPGSTIMTDPGLLEVTASHSDLTNDKEPQSGYARALFL
jgi:hypothetical protein